MKRVRPAISVGAPSLFAATLLLTWASIAQSEPVDPTKLNQGDEISVVKADFDRDGAEDVARLLVGAEDADLEITLADGKSVVAKALVFRGGVYGMQPSLALGPQGSLIVKYENTAIGRWKWEAALTIAHRAGAFVVAGYTYSGWDAIRPVSIRCDVNLLTGAGVLDGKKIKIKPRRIKMTSWNSERHAPKECEVDWSKVDRVD
ncbi:MAG: hypothetical protein MRY74_13620 [Neomegalonema sp.]|nr:hypothetical protein [Neomegalonema sp.]